jgi:uncharacterized protein YdhG (YjbR/CyaY superfamily)
MPQGGAGKGGGANEVDRYLAALPDDARDALQKLRITIKSVAPTATEGISYGIPVLKLQRRPLVGYGAARNHCALYVMSTEVTEAHAAELARYETGKGSVRFPPGKLLPAPLVKKLVKARIAENERLRPK